MNICAISGQIAKKPHVIGDGQSIRFGIFAPYLEHPNSDQERCALVHCVLTEPNEPQKEKLLAENAIGMHVEFTGRVAMTRYGTKDGKAIDIMDIIINGESLIIRGDE